MKSSQIFTGVIVGLAVIAIPSLIAYLIPNGWGSIFWFFGAFFGWFVGTTPVWNWLFVILLMSTVGLWGGLVFALLNSQPGDDYSSNLPTEQSIYGAVWRWRFSKRSGVHSLTCFCPKCDYQIHIRQTPRHAIVELCGFECENCGWKSESIECTAYQLEDRVMRKIELELRRSLDRASEAA